MDQKPHAQVLLTQMNLKYGLKVNGDNVNLAIMKELRQLHDNKALLPTKKEYMSSGKGKKSLG